MPRLIVVAKIMIFSILSKKKAKKRKILPDVLPLTGKKLTFAANYGNADALAYH